MSTFFAEGKRKLFSVFPALSGLTPTNPNFRCEGGSRRSVSAAKARMSLAHPSSSSQTLYLLFQALQLFTQTPSTSFFLIFRSLSRGKSSSTQSLSLIWNLGTCGTLLVVGMTLGSSVPLSSGVLSSSIRLCLQQYWVPGKLGAHMVLYVPFILLFWD